MTDNLDAFLKENFDYWKISSNGLKVVASKREEEHAVILDTTTLEEIARIEGQYERFSWIAKDTKIMATDFRVTSVYDASTGERLYGVEASY